MPVTAQWDNDDKTIIRFDVSGRWTWAEYRAANAEIRKMVDGLSYIVHFIVNPLDDQSRGYLPPGALQHIRSVYGSVSPNVGMTAVIGASPYYHALYAIGRKIYPQIAVRYRFANSLEEARALLSQELQRPLV
jgi:hypothetical protein